MTDRSMENHPNDRAGDRSIWAIIWHHKLYRDFWLICITGAVVLAFQANGEQTAEINANRIEATKTSCTKSNENSIAINRLSRVIQSLVLAGAALPGDTPAPVGVKDPSEWESIKPGPLSEQLQRQFPGFPTAQERLATAKDSAKQLEAERIELRRCVQEVQAVKSAAD